MQVMTQQNCSMYVGGHVDPNNSCSFISLLDGDRELENVERRETNVPTNPHMPYPPYPPRPNYPYPSITQEFQVGGVAQAKTAHITPTLLAPTST